MNITAKKLELRIQEYRKAHASYIQARTAMRDAVRNHLRVYEGTGELSGIAVKLDISMVQLSNLKGGYSIPSAATAEHILRATA